MAIEFKFYQNGEFEDPAYYVFENKVNVSELVFVDGEWMMDAPDFYLNWYTTLAIAKKLKELNESFKQQRILGVF